MEALSVGPMLAQRVRRQRLDQSLDLASLDVLISRLQVWVWLVGIIVFNRQQFLLAYLNWPCYIVFLAHTDAL